MKPSVLIVDDDEDIRTQMKWGLAGEFDVALAADRAATLEQVKERRPPVILLDLGLPPRPNDAEEGFLALGDILAADPLAKVIIITGQGDKKNAIKAVGEGAYDFMTKPIDMDELKVVLKRALHISQLEREYRDMKARVKPAGFEGMLGVSPSMQKVFADIRKVATTDAPVLILGETGTGKEMAALAVHRVSSRRDGPFVAINCSAIPETLLEGELFGHEKGAFTGAHQQRVGRIETAAGGTLFLDEIGEIPASIQVKLLRFLQEQCIQRVGGRADIEVDTRVIAATNVDLQEGIRTGRFREDLYYRLAVVVLRIPPLRERPGDIPYLAKSLLEKFAGEQGKDLPGFSPRTMQALEQYEWPGNVREMENRIKRAVIMAEGRRITVSDLELDVLAPGRRPGLTLKEARESLELDMIQRALARSKGKVSRAAEELGVSRPTLYDLMDKLGMKRDERADD